MLATVKNYSFLAVNTTGCNFTSTLRCVFSALYAPCFTFKVKTCLLVLSNMTSVSHQ